jgi:hypothetical protein
MAEELGSGFFIIQGKVGRRVQKTRTDPVQVD